MKKLERINLTSFGFTRREDLDFSDDGTKFRCYEFNTMRISLARACGDIFISCHSFATEPELELQYNEYSKLEHYKKLDVLNGVSEVYEEDIIELKNAITAYVAEYNELAAKLASENPTMQELERACDEIVRQRINELDEINERFTPAVLDLSDYDLKQFKYWYNSLKREIDEYKAKAKRIYNTSYSRQFMQTYKNNLKASYGYTNCSEYLSKINL